MYEINPSRGALITISSDPAHWIVTFHLHITIYPGMVDVPHWQPLTYHFKGHLSSPCIPTLTSPTPNLSPAGHRICAHHVRSLCPRACHRFPDPTVSELTVLATRSTRSGAQSERLLREKLTVWRFPLYQPRSSTDQVTYRRQVSFAVAPRGYTYNRVLACSSEGVVWSSLGLISSASTTYHTSSVWDLVLFPYVTRINLSRYTRGTSWGTPCPVTRPFGIRVMRSRQPLPSLLIVLATCHR
jgi:hypothetical protein